jgi:hypothetical protein
MLRPIKDSLKDSINRKLQIGIAAERKKWKRRRILFRSEWKHTDIHFESDYRKLLNGELPEPREGLKISSRFELLSRKTRGITINLFDWYQIRRSKETSDQLSVSVNPAGDILLERNQTFVQTRIDGNDIQLFKILSTYKSDRQQEDVTTWSFQKRDVFTRSRIRTILLSLLQLKTIREFDLPPSNIFPAQLELIWLTEFSGAAIEEVRKAAPDARWTALVKSFELFVDGYDLKNSFKRDWILSKKLRNLIDDNPIGAHLETIYPIHGRNEAERRIVVSQYRSVISFLRMMAE